MLKTIIATLFAMTLMVSGAFAQMSPSGDDCWTPVEAQAELERQGFIHLKTLTREEVENVKRNLLETDPTLVLNFVDLQLYDSPLDDMLWVALYNENPANADESCFFNLFYQTKEQIDEVTAVD